jgi:hypothetical protein
MSATAEEMSAQVEEVVASAETLSDMSQSLQKAVSVFKVGDEKGSKTNGSSKDLGFSETSEDSLSLEKEYAVNN